MTEFRVGIDYVCKIFQRLFPRRIVDKIKIKINVKNIWKQYYNKLKFGKKRIFIYLCMLIVLVRPHIYLKIFFYLATKYWSLWINKYENLHYWKKSKKPISKTL